MTNVLSFLDGVKRQTEKMHRKEMQEKLIKYYNTINQGKVSIPSFMLADITINEKYGDDYGRRFRI